MAGGRPRNSGEEICPNPNCRKLGLPFQNVLLKNHQETCTFTHRLDTTMEQAL